MSEQLPELLCTITLKNSMNNLPTIDLHHLSHEEAEKSILDFINYIDPPFQIITGKSEKMRQVVIDIIKDYGWSYHNQYFHNYGCLVILEDTV
jgi:16S rRNA G966 N2-methylase RsmD